MNSNETGSNLSKTIKRPYKIKHIRTGLYYKPGQINLVSRGGKIYNPEPDALTYYKECLDVHIKTNSKQHKILEEAGYTFKKSVWMLSVSIPSSEFVREEI